jgi:hypothetical protein
VPIAAADALVFTVEDLVIARQYGSASEARVAQLSGALQKR